LCNKTIDKISEATLNQSTLVSKESLVIFSIAECGKCREQKQAISLENYNNNLYK
jgi:hypothetical protein